MKKRLLKASKKYIFIFFLLFAYLIWILITDIKLPCMIYQLTGYQCPGCGLTRMCLALAKLDFKGAFYYNPYIFSTLPLFILCIVYPEIRYIKDEVYTLGKLKYLLYLLVIGFVSFGILRNFI